MTNNEKAPETEQSESKNNLYNDIICNSQKDSNIDDDLTVQYGIYKNSKNLKMPNILKDITYNFAKTLFPDTSISGLLVVVLSLLCHSIGHKHIAFDEFNDGQNVKQVNFYGINIANSGNGKDKLLNDLQNKIFEPIANYVNEKAIKYIAYQKEKIAKYANEIEDKEQRKIFLAENKIRNVVFTLYNATAEGFYEDNKAIINLGFGSMLCIISELALFLLENDDRKKQLFNMLYPAYDGEIITKSIKGENREINLKNANVNVLLATDPSLLRKKDVYIIFEYLLQTGLARRCFIVFQESSRLTVNDNAESEYNREKTAYSSCILKDKLFKIFLDIPQNANYKLPKEVYIKTFYPYKRYISKLYNNSNLTIIKKEIKSRILKALKLATLCACLNHPQKLYITDEDFECGISITEFLSQDFIKFYNYINNKDDVYDKIFNFLLRNPDKEFSKTELVNNHYKDFGISRENFRKAEKWESIIKTVEEIAISKGYCLQVNQNNGYKIKLENALNTEKISSEFKPLDEIL